MIPILVHRNSASSIRWDVNNTALDFFTLMSLTTCHINLRASGSMPADGSSNNMMGGFPIMAIPTESFRMLPPDSELIDLCLWSSRSSFLITLSIRGDLRRLGMPFKLAKNVRFCYTVSCMKPGLN